MIAFTSRLHSQPQVWVVPVDSGEPRQLTDGGDDSTSITPLWSPDGTKLLFNADGSDQRQLSPTSLGTDYVGSYQWWPAPVTAP